MPTSEEVKRNDALRGLFLSALWDDATAAQRQLGYSAVDQILTSIGAGNLSDNEKSKLVQHLAQDQMIESMEEALGDKYPSHVRLTSPGRTEVEQWIREPEVPTKHLAESRSNVNNTYIGTVHGAAIVGSTTGELRINVGVNAKLVDAVNQAVGKAREDLAKADLSAEDSQEFSDQLDVLQQEVNKPELDKGKIKRQFVRVLQLAGAGAGAGLAAAVSQETHDLLMSAFHMIGG